MACDLYLREGCQRGERELYFQGIYFWSPFTIPSPFMHMPFLSGTFRTLIDWLDFSIFSSICGLSFNLKGHCIHRCIGAKSIEGLSYNQVWISGDFSVDIRLCSPLPRDVCKEIMPGAGSGESGKGNLSFFMNPHSPIQLFDRNKGMPFDLSK